MSAEHKTPLSGEDHASESAEEPSIFVQPEGRDWFLAWLIGLADTYNIEQVITLTVGGTLITGRLIGGWRYFRELGQLILNADVAAKVDDPSSFQTELAESYSQWTEVYPEPDPSKWAQKDQPIANPNPRYIHLRNVRFVTADGAAISSVGTLWRGKLAAVDGFSLGEIEPGG